MPLAGAITTHFPAADGVSGAVLCCVPPNQAAWKSPEECSGCPTFEPSPPFLLTSQFRLGCRPVAQHDSSMAQSPVTIRPIWRQPVFPLSRLGSTPPAMTAVPTCMPWSHRLSRSLMRGQEPDRPDHPRRRISHRRGATADPPGDRIAELQNARRLGIGRVRVLSEFLRRSGQRSMDRAGACSVACSSTHALSSAMGGLASHRLVCGWSRPDGQLIIGEPLAAADLGQLLACIQTSAQT